MNQLKKFLIELPKLSDYEDSIHVERSVFQALYFSATEEGKHLNLLFSATDSQSEINPWQFYNRKDKPFYEFFTTKDYTHPSTQICGRVLQSREKIYRCVDCGYDDTCVICSYCFKRESHEGHNVIMYLSQAKGGMCDCGDETAFVRKFDCACLSEHNGELSLGFKASLRETVRIALDYVLDVTNYSITTLPFIHQNINGRGGLEVTSKDISNSGSLPAYAYGIEDVNTEDKWYLILWNDENHDYPEAEAGIRAATGMNDQQAKQVADEINRKGRAVLKESKCYTDLLLSQELAQADGLVATISSARDFLREAIILHILNWLKRIISFEGNASFRETSKQILAQVLLEPGFELSNPIPTEFLKSVSLDVKTASYTNGIPLEGTFQLPQNSKVDHEAKLGSLADSVETIITKNESAKLINSRILYLLAFEVRLISAARKKFTHHILPVLFSDATMRAIFCDQYIKAYPMLISVLAFSDREEELASASDISVQLFTCPRTNKWIFESANFSNLLVPLCQLIETQSSLINTDSFPNLVDSVFDIQSKREKSAVQSTIKTCIENVTRVITKNDETNLLNYILAKDNLFLFLAFLRFFQGLAPVVRKYGDHVERESITEFYSFILKAVPISSIVYHSARATNPNMILAREAVVLIFEYLKSRLSPSDRSTFKVSKDPVSPFNPLNSFFSFVLQVVGIDAVQEYFCNPKSSFFSVSDYSLRNVVLVNQVRTGLWVRNGISVARQICYLLDSLADVNYSRDVHLNQVAAIVDLPEDTMMRFLHRWELSEWFLGRVDSNETVYEKKFSFICEKLILFLYKLLVDRLNFDKLMMGVPNDELVLKCISYALCEEPRSYSTLKQLLPNFISTSESFDCKLKECADFQPPVGLYDVGMYRLKPSLYERLDPMGHVDEGHTNSIFEALFVNISKHNKSDIRKTILVPRISFSTSNVVNTRIGEIFRTTIFAKFTYKLLQVSINTGDEDYLPHLLHLLHAILLDGEQIYGINYLGKNFVTIPICNLLLTISESTMSGTITLKAEFLLEKFVSRDGSVMDSLLNCFGETHITSYKNRKDNCSETKRQKSTKIAQNRKAKIMKKFAKQQKKFIKGNGLAKNEESSLVSHLHEPSRRLCVYCGEPESVEKPFGIPYMMSQASVLWKITPNVPELVDIAFSDYSRPFKLEENQIYSKGFPRHLRNTLYVSSSCTHGVHVECQQRARFLDTFPIPCPLCHSFYDGVIPSLIHSQLFFDFLIFTENPAIFDPAKFEPQFNEQRNKKILKAVVQEDYFDKTGTIQKTISDTLLSIFKISSLQTRESLEKDSTSALEEIESLIAGTIKANEMSMRFDLEEANTLIMKKTPATLKSLIFSLIQSRVLLFETQKPFLTRLHKKNSSKTSQPSEDSTDDIFKEVVTLLFSTNETWHTILRYSFAKLIASTLIKLCFQFDTFLLEVKLDSSGFEFSSETTSAVKHYCEKYLQHPQINFKSKSSSYFENLLLALEKCVLPFLRQCAILKDILLCKESFEADKKSHVAIGTLYQLCELNGNGHKYSSSPFCKLLNLPELTDILDVSTHNGSLKFELDVLEFYNRGKGKNSMKTSALLDYPNVPRLISLPNEYNCTITDPRLISPSDTVCLVCGEMVPSWLKSSHQNECAQICLLFCPEENSITTVIKLGDDSYEIKIPGPYMTVHGEVKAANLKEKATLNHMRYSNLNKLWINQDLLGFATRTMYGERFVPLETDLQAETMEEETFDDLELWE